MMYKCSICQKIFDDKISSLPTIGRGDGCCKIGSLIELDPYIAIMERFRRWQLQWDEFDNRKGQGIEYPVTKLHDLPTSDDFIKSLRVEFNIKYNVIE